jgi:hypothetical protein
VTSPETTPVALACEALDITLGNSRGEGATRRAVLHGVNLA